jgi:[ribosomal protein S18]-alanine N-acetyltransferase
MSLVALTSHHAQAMAALHKASFDSPWDEDTFKTFLNLPTYCSFGWMDEDLEIAGFLLFNVISPEIELCTICILPDFRRQGIARKLLQQSVKKFSDCEVCFLEVAENNTGAIALYSNIGFTNAGVRKNYYKRSDGRYENAVLMRLSLD